jgi:anti-sigma factor RsiW
MSTERTHPTDTTLIMAIDRELSTPRREALHAHLMACDECAARLSALEAAAAESARLCGDDTSDDGRESSGLRARVQQRIFELRNERDRSLLFRVRRIAGPVSLLAQIGIAVALLVLIVKVPWPGKVGVPTAAPGAESLPIAQLTPGATANVRVTDLCSGSAPSPRNVSLAVRQQVLHQYRMEYVPASEYELDYLITPELGGVGDARNLWPERYGPGPWNAHVKDDLERLLSRLVCNGSMDLAAAQREIAANWIEAYKKHFETDHPIPRQAGIEDEDDEIQFADAAFPFGHDQ